MKREYDFSRGVRGNPTEAAKKILAAKPKPKCKVRVKMWVLFWKGGDLAPDSFRFHRYELENLQSTHPHWIWTIRPVIVEWEIPAKGKEK